jgi:hypothetical protein
MDTTKLSTKSTVGTVTADNFSDLLENGYIANIMRDNPRAHEAWRNSINLADRPEPAMHEIRIAGTPLIAAVDEDIAAGIAAVAHVPAVPDFYRFEHTNAGNLSAAGLTSFRAALEKHDTSLERDRFLNAQTMQNLYSSYSSDLQRIVRDSDPLAFDNCLQSYSLWTFTELTRLALTSTNLNSASQAIHALLNQPGPIRSGDLKSTLNSQSLRTAYQAVKNLFGNNDDIPIAQLAVHGFLHYPRP